MNQNLRFGPFGQFGSCISYTWQSRITSNDIFLILQSYGQLWTRVGYGGFQLLDLIIPELKSHVIPYKFKSSHWLKLQHSDWRANLVKDFFYK